MSALECKALFITLWFLFVFVFAAAPALAVFLVCYGVVAFIIVANVLDWLEDDDEDVAP